MKPVPYVGNFPVVDPETGEVKGIPARYRARSEFLDDFGREIPDPRPVAAAVMFAAEESADSRIKRMLNQALATMQHRMDLANTSGEEFYDDDDFSEFENPIDPRYVAATEFVYNDDLKREVPRVYDEAHKADKKAAGKRKPKEAISPTPSPSPSPTPPPNETEEV